MDVKRKISRLEARLSARFDLVTDAVPVGPLRVQFSRVRDPQKVLNDLCDKIDAYERLTGKRVDGDELGLPYWAELWDSSIGVGQWLIRESVKWRATSDELHSSSPVARRSVLDLGCGLGLCGTVAGLLGADVLFADLEADCLLFSLLNGLRYNPRSAAKRVNWQTDNLGRRFDLIIGSDVLYDRSQWVYLHPFFQNHLAPGGTILLGARRRPGTLSIEVIDTGIGIDADTGHHVFKAFRQADSASDGLGLGLWIVARTAAMLGHAATLASTPGRGTRFTVSVARPDDASAAS